VTLAEELGVERRPRWLVAATVEEVRAKAGPQVPIITAVGGARGAAGVSSGVLLGTGLGTAVPDRAADGRRAGRLAPTLSEKAGAAFTISGVHHATSPNLQEENPS
jgi:hypothetical protein